MDSISSGVDANERKRPAPGDRLRSSQLPALSCIAEQLRLNALSKKTCPDIARIEDVLAERAASRGIESISFSQKRASI
jgi:hypothetical protein